MQTPTQSVHPDVQQALTHSQPVIAIESTIFSHGLPWPDNQSLADRALQSLQEQGVCGAIIGVIDGVVQVGLTPDQLRRSCQEGPTCHKFAGFDFPWAVAVGATGTTTVAGTLYAAYEAGIEIMATGGIGGVHRGWQGLPDISHDIQALARFPMLVVAAGVKAILDVPATVEQLETHGILTVGWRCQEFPTFYSRKSGIPLRYAIQDAASMARLLRASDQSGILLANPCPEGSDLETAQVERWIAQALMEAQAAGIGGKDLTPFLLSKLHHLSEGRTTVCNQELFISNVILAGNIAKALVNPFSAGRSSV